MTISMTSSMSKKALWLAPLSAAMLMLAGCNNSSAPAENAEADTATEAPLNIKIATESSYKPFSYTDADGKLIGYEIELVDALCAQMKAECEVISQDWDGLIPGLNAQKFDAAIAGMSITPERKEVVDFSDPYFHSGIILIGKKGDDLSVESLTGLPIASQRSTVASQYLQDEHADADIKLYDTQDNAYLDLTSGRVRGMMSDKVTGIDWLKTDAGKGYEVKGEEISTNDDAMGIAFRKGDPLVAKFNAALAELKDNGTYDQITGSYFGTSSTAAAQKAVATTDSVEEVMVAEEEAPAN
ncbi:MULTISPECIES: transporter substrate-binding domain-containing protein [Psychrobacter]|jgi:ABC-type amino acid transport substrate-binding protein|uniref:transporter substrate-binding domain-containing protein n=1 Tax=Psychrobacter TaxID=497 RepID=UPI000C33C8CE|nr:MULTISPECIES: transporter substrate-binding domain-containing protein [Psychrobacter]MBA6243976.1 transporter substrate-binding domain-containing protein [Psychrobacter sp. Urea-trap-18]MBA6287192.1 transporter substrate-binding domain-containing protein [Psychrobacter sp. Urea-trap-16]MBA6318306.1 transporter substrate-binding domain-containing protein [Psychrobacter sp. Urea-trap-20]MBA6335250.1 transporter substrate-binding domain-containing protein [Psychrobacter sp. Urea-trap-19]PKG603